MQHLSSASMRSVCAAPGAYNPKNAIKPNPVLLGSSIGVYMVTRTCQNNDATFSTDDNCVMPVMTSQTASCQVSSCLRTPTETAQTALLCGHLHVCSLLHALHDVVAGPTLPCCALQSAAHASPSWHKPPLSSGM